MVISTLSERYDHCIGPCGVPRQAVYQLWGFLATFGTTMAFIMTTVIMQQTP
jgi:hypothetical protein